MEEALTFLSLEDGLCALDAIRDTIVSCLDNKYPMDTQYSFPQVLRRKQGTFVSIVEKMATKAGQRELYLLCMGNPLPSHSLIDGALNAATELAIRLSSTSDALSRLPSLLLRLDVVGGLELLTVTSPIRYREIVRLGDDGLMVERGHYKGALLPRLPIVENWGMEEFLSQCCTRAGLMADAWLDKAVRIYRFQTQVFEGTLLESK